MADDRPDLSLRDETSPRHPQNILPTCRNRHHKHTPTAVPNKTTATRPRITNQATRTTAAGATPPSASSSSRFRASRGTYVSYLSTRRTSAFRLARGPLDKRSSKGGGGKRKCARKPNKPTTRTSRPSPKLGTRCKRRWNRYGTCVWVLRSETKLR